MLQGMDQSEFGQFVAALWERQGWQTQVKRNDGRVFVAVQRPETGEEGLLWAIPGDAEVAGKQVQQFASLCQQYDVEEVAIVTAGSVSDHAEKVAKGTGIELLDGEGVAAILKRKGWTDLVDQYGSRNEEGDDGGSGQGDERDDSPLGQVSAVLEPVVERASTLVSNVVGDSDASISWTPVIVAVLVVGLLGAGFLYGPSIPFIGGGGGGPISAASATPTNSTTTLEVDWNAKVIDSIDPNETDGKAYYPPEGEQFVLVRMSINNTGEQKVSLKQSAFKLQTEERTYAFQPLADHDGFLDFPISPGQHYVGWTVFTVPKGTTGTLIYDQNATAEPVAVSFSYDSGLPVDVSQQ